MFTRIFISIVSTFNLVSSASKNKLNIEQSIIYKVDGNLILNVDDWESIPNVPKIVIDLTFLHYVEAVSIILEGTAELNVSVRKMDDGSYQMCSKTTGNNFRCDAFSKYIEILSSNKVNGTNIYGYGTNFENYVGCFKLLMPRRTRIVNSSTTCSEKCYLSWYGLTMDFKCVCFPSLKMFKPLNLSQCNNQCGDYRLQFCGSGENNFAVYSKSKEPIWQQGMPTLSCLYDGTGCPRCAGGRSGDRCDVIDCSVNNGNCGTRCSKAVETSGFEYSRCTCEEGFVFGDNLTCGDLNECHETPCPSDHQCINTHGSYHCNCKPGYKRDDNNACIDIDECSLENPICEPNTTICNNTIGDFECSCLPGYFRISILQQDGCRDINECRDNPCALFKGQCRNIIGSYTCQCGQGYKKINDTLCEDIDECQTQSTCDLNTTLCMNIPGDFECACHPGLVKTILEKHGACQEAQMKPSGEEAINDFNILAVIMFAMFYVFAVFAIGMVIHFYRKYMKGAAT